MQSEQINEIAKALAAAQAEITGAKKSGLNPHLKSKYADLEDSWEAIREPMSKNGLSIWQGVVPQDEGPALRTLLMHESGQWLESVMPMVFKDASNPQVVGTVISYFRRYALKAAVGLYDTDDDGASAANQKAKPQQEAPARKMDVQTYATRIAACKDMNILQSIWNSAIRERKETGDEEGFLEVRKMKDDRKAMLEPPQEAATQDGEVV